MEITGTLVVIYPVVQKTEKFRTREFVLEISEEIQGVTYTNYAVMQAINGSCDYLDENPNTESARYVVSDVVTVSFSLNGYLAKSSGNYYTVLQAHRIVDAPMTYQPYNSTQGQVAGAAPMASMQGGSTGLPAGSAGQATMTSQAAPMTNSYAGYQQPVGQPGQTFDDLPF